jgi:hypothetical protein
MNIHTVKAVAGRTVTVRPSKLDDGMVTLTVFSADKQHLCAVTFVPCESKKLADALGFESEAVVRTLEVVTVPVREYNNWFDVNQAARGAA